MEDAIWFGQFYFKRKNANKTGNLANRYVEVEAVKFLWKRWKRLNFCGSGS